MWKKLKEVLSIILSDRHETEASKKADILIKGIVSILLGLASLLLSIINIITKNWLMLCTTLVLTVGFGISGLLLLKFKNRKFIEPIIASIIIIVFTYYAISGQNDGFAVLWILLCPAISTLFFSFRRGIVLSTYFFLLLIFVFTAPILFPSLKDIIPAYYRNTPGYYEQFTIRYPVLYISSFVVSIFLNSQKIYYFKMAEAASVRDAMTSLRNRRYFNDYVSSIGVNSKVDNDFTIFSIDINNLKTVNDNLGHEEGDFAIRKTAEILHEVFQNITVNIYRTGGDEFFVFFDDPNNDTEQLIETISKLSSQVKIGNTNLSLSIGSVKGREYINKNFGELLIIVDQEMYKKKRKYYEEHFEENHRTFKNIRD